MDVIQQLRELDQKREQLLTSVITEIEERIEILKAAGSHYRLVQVTDEQPKIAGEKKKRKTTEEAFLAKMTAACNRKWGKKIAMSKRDELWAKEEPLAKKFYATNYRDGVNVTGEKYKVHTVSITK